MTALQRKLLRDVFHLRGQVLAIALVVACGVAAVVTTRTAYLSLSRSQSSYYAAFRFADIFASLKRAPDWITRRIAAIPGVAGAQTRIVFDVTVDLPGRDEPATARLISIPERRVPILNDLYLRRGRWLEPGHRDEVIISDAFASANHLDVGDSVGAILNARWQKLRIVGVALSPEYVYEIRGTDLFPNNQQFGVFWMSRDAMGPAFDMDGAFNDVVLALAPEADREEVIARLDRILEPYGGLGAIAAADQVSNRFISDEIRQNEVTGNVVPMIFLGVAAFLLNIVLTRLINVQRDQIGVLKAFGYGRLAVSVHYLQLALIASLGGAAFGLAVGTWLGAKMLDLYVEFYRFPVYEQVQGPRLYVFPLGLSLGAAMLGALGAVRQAFSLPAAEAMRAEPPPRFRKGLLERLGGQRLVSLPTRMIVRNLTRRPLRAFLSTLGIALAVAVLIMGRFFLDAVNFIADVQFRLVQRDDVTVASLDPLPAAARHEYAHLPGVMRAEPFRIVPARLRSGHRTYRVGLMGLDPQTQLRQLIGRDLAPVPLPSEGIVLTSKLAEILEVHPGEAIQVEVLEGERPKRAVVVSGLVDELLGLSAYIDVRALHRLLQEGGTVSGALLQVDSERLGSLQHSLKRLPALAGSTRREASLEAMRKTMGENLGIFTAILVVFACVIAFAVVYNAARIALSERGRELASLRVLGFTRREVMGLLLGEQALLTLASLPLGFALGYGACRWMSESYQTDLFRIPLFISMRTYLFAVLVIVVAALGSALIVGRRVVNLDLVAVLKTRE